MNKINQRNLRTRIPTLATYLWAIIVAAGIMSLSIVMVSCTAVENPPITPSPEVPQKQESLSNSLANHVLEEVSNQTKIPLKNLSIIEANRETWSDGCLGLGQPNELCTQALVEGWQIIISDSNQTWTYRTDLGGQNLRLER